MQFKDLKKGLLTITAMAFIVFACDSPMDYTINDDIDNIELGFENGDIIEGQYIVTFHEPVTDGDESVSVEEAMNLLNDFYVSYSIDEQNIFHQYHSTLVGFAGILTKPELDEIRNDPRVKDVEPDRYVVFAPPCGTPRGGPCPDPDPEPEPEPDPDDPGDGDGGDDTGALVPWGVERVGGAGNGVGKTAWVLDTGIDYDHPDLNVDRSRSFTAFSSGPDAKDGDDRNGHGTHVAGTIAANGTNIVGVAAGATLIAVKVLDRRGSGSYSAVIAGVDYVAANAAAGDVANMSLGGPVSDALDNAVLNAASKGIKFSLAAGNDGNHAGNYSPARVTGTNIVTISATDINDVFASWSNYGNPPIDFAAPGVSIYSTWNDGGYRTISGTSMAAPHVAGIWLLGNINSNGTAIGDPSSPADPIAHR